MTKRNNQNIRISEALKDFVEENRLEHGLNKVKVSAAWVEVMGIGVNNYTQGLQLEQDTLYVSLSSSVLREELSYGKEKIMSMLNEHLGSIIVKKIVLR